MEFEAIPPPFTNCSNITEQNLKNLALTRGITGLVCFVLCLITLITELVLACRRRKFRTILHRLFIYLTISTAVYLAVLSLHIEHYFEYPFRHKFCIAIGFLDQYTGSVQLFFTFGITAFLFYKVFTVCQDCIRPLPCEGNRCYSLSLEVIFVIVSFLIPLAFDWVPFVLTPYGETGPWCWIESVVSQCKESKEGFWEQMLLWYIPFGLVALCSFGLILAMVAVFVCMRYREVIRIRIDGIIKETCLLLAFLVVFCLLCLIEVVTRLVLYKNESIYTLWLIYAISTPISGVIIPIGFLSYLQCKLCCCTNRKHGHELDDTLEDSTVPKSIQVSAPSVTTTQKFHTSSKGENEASITEQGGDATPLTETRPLLEHRFGRTCNCM